MDNNKRRADDSGYNGNEHGLFPLEESTPKKRRGPGDDYMAWDVEGVCQYLAEHGFEDLAPIFADEEITGSVLCDITEAQLTNMGIDTLGRRLRILQLIGQLKEVQMPTIPFAAIRDQFKVFNDPIHGHIELHPVCIKIMDTPQFQRLRYLKQLGGSYFVFPGASNNRFEHCIGVCHLAGQFVQALQSKQPELAITEEDILCVQIAGLCHDLGHGPFSHTFDGMFIPLARPGYKWTHEDASVQMLDFLILKNELMPYLEEHGLGERDITFIKELIAGPQISGGQRKGKWQFVGRNEDKSFLYEIVANKRSGIDADKWDYFARDCHHLGINNNFDHMRFMSFARVLKSDGQLQICSRDKEVDNLYDMFHTRTALHRRAYQHKTGKIVEIMITEAMLKADQHILYKGENGKLLRISETVDDMTAYSKLNDHVYHQILLSNDPNLIEAQKILQRIECRDLYKCVGQTKPASGVSLKKKELTDFEQEIANAMTEDELGCAPLTAEDLIVQIISLDYGMKEKNPIDQVRFYRKTTPKVAFVVRKHQVSQMLPEIFAEQRLRVFCRKTDKQSLEVATKCFHRWCATKNFSQPKDHDELTIDMTPVKHISTPSSTPIKHPQEVITCPTKLTFEDME